MKNIPGPANRSFTLLELLLVVAIIVLLAGILLPALKTAKEKSKQIQCTNNLKQIGTMAYCYTNDHNDYFPSFDYHVVGLVSYYYWRWQFLNEYNGNKNNVDWNTEQNPQRHGIGCPATRKELDLYDYTYELNLTATSPTQATSSGAPTRLAKFTMPSRTLFIFDAEGGWSSTFQSVAHPLIGTEGRRVRERHIGKANFLIVDGHTELKSYNGTIYPAVSTSMWTK